MKMRTVLYCVASLILSIACSGGHCGVPADTDETYSSAHLREVGAQDLNVALDIVDEGLKTGRLSEFQADMFRANLIYQFTDNYKDACTWCRSALELPEAQNPVVRKDILYRLAVISEAGNDFAACIDACTEGKLAAHAAGSLYDEYAFDYMVGRSHYKLDNDDKGLEMMRKAIAGASGCASSEEEYGHLVFFTSTLVSSLLSSGNYAEALLECDVFENLLSSMEASYPGAGKLFFDEQHFYIDNHRAVAYAKSGKKHLAEESFARALKRNHAQDPDGKMHQADYYAAMGDVENILRIYNDEIPLEPASDTLNRFYRLRLARMEEAFRNAGQSSMADEYAARYEKICVLIEQQEFASQPRVKAADYATQNEHIALTDTLAAMKNHQIGTVLSFVGLVLIVALLFFLGHRKRAADENAFREKVDEMEQNLSSIRSQVKLIAEEIPSVGSDAPKTLKDLIEGRKLYLNQDINRDAVAELLGISQSALTAQLNAIEPGISFPDYIKALRIRHALGLLKAHPDLSVTDLAQRSGFYSVRTFQRAFLAVTGKSVRDYVKSNTR